MRPITFQSPAHPFSHFKRRSDRSMCIDWRGRASPLVALAVDRIAWSVERSVPSRPVLSWTVRATLRGFARGSRGLSGLVRGARSGPERPDAVPGEARFDRDTRCSAPVIGRSKSPPKRPKSLCLPAHTTLVPTIPARPRFHDSVRSGKAFFSPPRVSFRTRSFKLSSSHFPVSVSSPTTRVVLDYSRLCPFAVNTRFVCFKKTHSPVLHPFGPKPDA